MSDPLEKYLLAGEQVFARLVLGATLMTIGFLLFGRPIGAAICSLATAILGLCLAICVIARTA